MDDTQLEYDFVQDTFDLCDRWYRLGMGVENASVQLEV